MGNLRDGAQSLFDDRGPKKYVSKAVREPIFTRDWEATEIHGYQGFARDNVPTIGRRPLVGSLILAATDGTILKVLEGPPPLPTIGTRFGARSFDFVRHNHNGDEAINPDIDANRARFTANLAQDHSPNRHVLLYPRPDNGRNAAIYVVPGINPRDWQDPAIAHWPSLHQVALTLWR